MIFTIIIFKFAIITATTILSTPSNATETNTTTTTCTRTCNGTQVNYPFGFNPNCEFQLNCTYDGRMEFQGLTIRDITWQTLSLTISRNCTRPLTHIRTLFGSTHALTSRTGLILQNCTSISNSGCDVPSSLVGCGGDNMGCFGPGFSGQGGGLLRYEDVVEFGCGVLVSSYVLEEIGGSENENGLLELERVEVGWWMSGLCGGCDVNAECSMVGARGFRCRCKDGFVGDGFVDGLGCRNASSSDPRQKARGSKIPILVGGIVIGAASLLILYGICYFCHRRSIVLPTHTNSKQLLCENTSIPLYSYKELERATNGFSERQRLGTGAYGTVYAGKLHNNEFVAIKKLKHRDTDSIDQVMNEIKLLSYVSHPNLVRLLGCCIENGEQILVYEYMPNGTLSQHLQRESGKALPWSVRLTIASETARAISYLHSSMNPPIYHRDIKSSNILLDFDFKSKVADFGLSRLGMMELSHISTAPQGTPGYVDPQYHQNFHLSDKSDVYSFGVVLVEIITAMKVVDFNRPQSEVNLASLAIDRIGKGRVDEIIDPYIELHRDAQTLDSVLKVAELAFRCLAYHRDMRPSMMEVAHELEQIRQLWWAPMEENVNMGSSFASSHFSTLNRSERSFGGLSIMKSIVGSQRVVVPQRGVVDHLACLAESNDSSLESVNEPWFSEHSSPTNSYLGNGLN